MASAPGLRAFSAFGWSSGKLADCDPNFPTDLYAWTGTDAVELPDGGTHFGFVVEGPATLIAAQGTFVLQTGMYFSVPGGCSLSGGRGIAMTRLGHDAFFHVGGPVERRGRLKYVDGCTDSLLIPPIRMGDPCLNLLYFPEGIDQTAHTHPSDRIGCIFSGRGECVTPEGDMALEPGMIFRIHADGSHKFRTLQGSDMVVIAYHPDSDFGPTDRIHPMINRTIVDGVSASELDAIRTA
jgi:quercetin dioxygenase-like cupin family protein